MSPTAIAAGRQCIPLADAGTIVTYATQIAIVLIGLDGFIDSWTAAVALAVVAACPIGFRLPLRRTATGELHLRKPAWR